MPVLNFKTINMNNLSLAFSEFEKLYKETKKDDVNFLQIFKKIKYINF